MNHKELCKITADWAIKNAFIALYEYQSYATSEFPDVFVVGSIYTTLYEIKTSRADFISDAHKDARKKWKPKGYLQIGDYKRVRSCGKFCPLPQYEVINFNLCKNCDYFAGKTTHYDRKTYQTVDAVYCTYDGGAILKWVTENPELYYIEKPHLGVMRYFVCENEIIKESDLPEGWGLYWVKNGRFYLKHESKKFKPNLLEERNIITHAFRRYASGDSTGIIVNTYK